MLKTIMLKKYNFYITYKYYILNFKMIVLIMAGGLGKRMESELPKVCHQVISLEDKNISKPMLIQVILTAIKLNPEKIYLIVGKYKDLIENTIRNYLSFEDFELINWIIQENPLGTGHAIMCGIPELQNHLNTQTIILSGDVPLVSVKTLRNLLGLTNKLLITELNDPTGCGRIILNESKQIIKIIEEKDCTLDEKLIKLVNCGIYQINSNDLIELLPKIRSNNNSNEYYLTDIVGLMLDHNIKIEYYCLPNCFQYEVKNVNTKDDLENLNKFIMNVN